MNRSQLAVSTAAACLVLLISGCTDSEPSESTSTNGTGMSADEAAALAVINDAYAAFNSGDAERWTEARAAGVTPYESEEARVASLAEETEFFRERIAAGVQFTDVQCTSHGEGAWPIEGTEAPAAEGYHFTCSHNDGGGTYVTKWVVADGKVVAAGSD